MLCIIQSNTKNPDPSCQSISDFCQVIVDIIQTQTVTHTKDENVSDSERQVSFEISDSNSLILNDDNSTGTKPNILS